jgi:hypothetical protein
MGEGERSPLNLNALLAAVEAAPPVAAVDVLAGALAEAIDAREVGFLLDLGELGVAHRLVSTADTRLK